MSTFYHFWKIWLRKNSCEKDVSKEYLAEIPSRGILKDSKDVAERLVAEGIDINYNTLIYVINQYDRIVRNMICEGYSVKTNNVIFNPTISGNWSKECLEFTTNEYKCSIDCKLTPEMREATNLIGIKVMGVKDESYFISKVTDVKSGQVDSVISRNGDIIIEGKDIKAIAKDGSTNNCAILMKDNNTMVDISDQISVNETDKIILRVPSSLEKGSYRLLIQTYFSGETNEKTEYCRCIEFNKKLTVK